MTPIGMVRSAHRERHMTPRQASAADEAVMRSSHEARIELNPEVIPEQALQDLDGFDTIWVLGHFHLNQGWKSQVIPPRGPRVKRGLLATRSPHRPNGIALSACGLVKITGHVLWLSTCDLLDGTPVLDIKPYVAFADSFPASQGGWVDELDLEPKPQ